MLIKLAHLLNFLYNRFTTKLRRIVLNMSIFRFAQKGITVELREKTNVMSPLTIPLLAVFSFAGVVLVFCPLWAQIVAMVLVCAIVLFYFFHYHHYTIKSPELLQTEKFRTDIMKIEAQMQESKTEPQIGINSTIEARPRPALEQSTIAYIESEDTEEVE